MAMKRVVAISDLHAGHLVGLTPPAWRSPLAVRPLLHNVQREMWNFYESTLRALQPIDALLVLGDCIDGKGARSGGTEQITTDMREQRRIAATCIGVAKAAQIVMVYGTPYHVGPEGEDYEKDLADDLGATIGGHEWAEAHGVVFDLKHKVGGSQVPHGRHTAIARERLWNVLWHERELAPKANIVLRGHVHYFNYCGGADWLGITMPALQGPGSKYGVRQCSGTVHFGLVSFDIQPDGSYTWQPHLLPVRAARPVPVKL